MFYVPVHANDFPLNGDVSQVAALHPSPMPLPLSQQQQPVVPIPALPDLTEEGFMDLFMRFSHATGIRLSEQDFNIEGRQVNPWTLHRAVIARGGFDSVRFDDKPFLPLQPYVLDIKHSYHGHHIGDR
jgi:hypothetical protein